MLRPIKSFLTYLQKNANGSSIFGTTSAGMSETNIENGDLPPPQPTTITTEITPLAHVEAEVSIVVEPDDIVVLSPQKTPHDQNENEVTSSDRNASATPTTDDDEMQSDDVQIVDVETPHIDLCSDSNDDLCKEETQRNQINTSVESNEVIIFEDTNHSDSIVDPLNDPLAIDDYNGDISSNNITSAAATLGPSDLDTSTECEVLFVIDAVPEIVDHTGKPDDTCVLIGRDDRYVASNLRLEEINSEEQEVRSDGSDSGLGSETSTLQSANTSAVVDSPVSKTQPGRSNLKRRSDNVHDSIILQTKRSKRSINFNAVSVYYFPRIQGFACVPSQGGCTLGMAARHVHSKTFTLAEHAAEQRRVHKQQMQEINPRGSSSDDTDSDEEISEASGSDLDADANGFLQPVPARQRRALLKSAGIRKIDPTEKDECRSIRSSREFCGCSCRGYCDPDTCSCSQAGIKCQVDRPSFPCGCTRDGCANVVGRVEFNPSRVRTHYIHTIMRLDLENKQKRADELDSAVANTSMLSYANSSVTSSMVNCTTGVNSLNNLCNYNNLVSTNHIRQQQQMYGASVSGGGVGHLQHNQNNFETGANGIYSSRLHSSIIPSTSQLEVDEPPHQQRLLTNSSHTINDSLSRTLQNTTNHNHDIDLHYAFRDDNPTSVEIAPNNSNNLLVLDDYPSTSDSLYHEVYNGHSFLNQNYINTALCLPQNSTYSSYQQNFISYASTASTPVDISDLANVAPTPNDSGGDGVSSVISGCADTNICINLHSLVGNPSRFDAMNDLLHSSRSTVPTSSITPTTTTDPITLVSCVLAPSAQTSTSITEGTQTTVTQPQIAKNSTTGHSHLVETKLKDFIDLTEHKSQKNELDDDVNRLTTDVIEIIDAKAIKVDDDSMAEFMTSTTATISKACTTNLSGSVATTGAGSMAAPAVLVVSAVEDNLSDIIKNNIAEIVLAVVDNGDKLSF